MEDHLSVQMGTEKRDIEQRKYENSRNWKQKLDVTPTKMVCRAGIITGDFHVSNREEEF